MPGPELEETAIDLWRDPALRRLEPEDAAAEWLVPVGALRGQDRDPSANRASAAFTRLSSRVAITKLSSVQTAAPPMSSGSLDAFIQ